MSELFIPRFATEQERDRYFAAWTGGHRPMPEGVLVYAAGRLYQCRDGVWEAERGQR